MRSYTARGGVLVWVFEGGLGDGKEFYVFVYVRNEGLGIDCVCVMGPSFFLSEFGPTMGVLMDYLR